MVSYGGRKRDLKNRLLWATDRIYYPKLGGMQLMPLHKGVEVAEDGGCCILFNHFSAVHNHDPIG